MIEVNLLPGGKKGGGGGNPLAGLVSAIKGLASGGGGGGGMPDPYMIFAVVAGIVGLGYIAFAYLGATGDQSTLEEDIAQAREDSTRFAVIIESTNRLTAQRDSIAQRVQIIQDIDADRYVWSHILDEIATAVPEYTWLREVLHSAGEPLQVRVNGRAGSMYAVTNFMRRLEASRFLRAVTMERSEQAPSEDNPEDLVYVFELLITYDPPNIDELETVPLFENESAAAQSAEPTGN